MAYESVHQDGEEEGLFMKARSAMRIGMMGVVDACGKERWVSCSTDLDVSHSSRVFQSET